MTTDAACYVNKLEEWYGTLPEPVQTVFRPLFDVSNTALEAVAGNPQQVMSVADRYPVVAHSIIELATEQRRDCATLSNTWRGDVQEAFDRRMADIEATLHTLAEATARTPEILRAGAEACVDGANMIVDIVVAVVTWAVESLVVHLALSVLTYGLTIVAWAAEQVAGMAVAAAESSRVIATVARVLNRIADILNRIAKLIHKLIHMLKELKAVGDDLAKVRKLTPLVSTDRLALAGASAAYKFGLQEPIENVVTRGIQDQIKQRFEERTGVALPEGRVEHILEPGKDVSEIHKDIRRALDPP